MTDIDLGAQFDKISDKAKSASDKLKAANQGAKDRLETDAIQRPRPCERGSGSTQRQGS